MVAPERSPLAGLVEVDEASIAYHANDDPPVGGGRNHQRKLLVAGAVKVRDGGPGRICLTQIADFSARSLHAMPAANLASGATVRIDGWASYPPPDLPHDPRVVGAMAAHIVLPWFHRVFSNLKTWAPGVYHGL